jgi:hypothetical protein
MSKYALLIGVETYGEGLQPLPAAPNDVKALQEVLLNPDLGAFDEVKPLINPNRSDMEEQVEEFFQNRQQEDLVLLFFSGHGVKDDKRNLYFASAKTRIKRGRLTRSTATSAQFIHDCLSSCKAKRQVLILDCCFSGAFGALVARDDGKIPLEKQLGAEGRVVLASTSAIDYSFEEKGTNQSIYTRYLVKGIATGTADENGDGVITIDELHHHTAGEVKEASPNMSPTLITLKDEGFRIQVARSPQHDPKLKYRKEAELRATGVEFTIPARKILDDLRGSLGLSDAEAKKIEADALKPYLEYQDKLDGYEEILRKSIEEELPLSERTINDLQDYRTRLGFKPENVAEIERIEWTVLNGRDLKGYAADLKQVQEAQQREEAKCQQSSSSRQSIDDDKLVILKVLKNLDYHNSRHKLRDYLSSHRTNKKIGIFYLESSEPGEVVWHFYCLLKEFFVTRYNREQQIKRLQDTSIILDELCQENKNFDNSELQSVRNIYEQWKIAKVPTLILVENSVCPKINFPWKKIVKNLALLHQKHPGVPFVLWFFGRNSYFHTKVKKAFTEMEAAITASSDSEKFCVINFSDSNPSKLNKFQSRGIDDFLDLRYNEILIDRLEKILQVDPERISTTLYGMNSDQYSQETGYEVWNVFFKNMDKTKIWEDIQVDYLQEYEIEI